MKHFFLVLLACVLFLSVPAYALTLSDSVQKVGDVDGTPATIFGTFKTKDAGLTDELKAQLREFFQFPEGRCLVTYTEGNFLSSSRPAIMFMFLLDSYDTVSGQFKNGSFWINENVSFDVFIFSYPTLEFDHYTRYVNASDTSVSVGKLLYYGFDIQLTSDDKTDCQIDYDTDLVVFQDDGGIMGDAEKPPAEDGGILAWLKGFWDALLDFFKRLIIPKDGFFEDWFAEIKAAADKKFGGLSGLYASLKKAFTDLQADTGTNSTLIWEVGSGKMYDGSPGFKVDLMKSALPYLPHIKGWLTAIIVIITAIVCYRRLVVMFEQ